MILFPLVIANLKMIYRNRQALFWALVFPLIFVTVFGLFRLDEPPEIEMQVVDRAKDGVSTRLLEALDAVERVTLGFREDEAAVRAELAEGKASYLLILPEGLEQRLAQSTAQEPVHLELLYDRSSQTAPIIIGLVRQFVEETNQQLVQAPTLLDLKAEGVQARQLTYFDFLLPGLVGMGVMTYSIIGLASAVALYREQKILKRILATPLRVRTFFASQVVAHLILSVAQALVIIAFGVVLFSGHVYGNLLGVLLLVVIGNIVFLNLGFIVGAVARNVRAADGLSNAISLPMMFFSGVFFPNESLPKVLASVVDYLPLSPLLDAMRGVALEARPFWEYPTELAILGGWIVVSSLVAVKLFRFN